MVEYVFDTEPLIAFLYNEEGHEAVNEILNDIEAGRVDGVLAEVNATELLYKVARIEGDGTATSDTLRSGDRDIRALKRRGVSIKRADWHTAGVIKADGSISLGDAYAVALAHDRDATLLVGGDDDFNSLPVDVTVQQFRDHGV
ncbi:VapC toxin family PIN domain ribonuclease [Halorubrum ezzemoulense]|uniref:Type II toxin-antitoxin system VapC family toxin n=2 Tax=Halorubrum TaxID=56688 RepID=A0A256KB20_HALEZ|nr:MULTISPECIES: PIN domain-containing protein [Halorubrum]MDB2252196.1 PIN domain-containing protein [Halorubrum ezzemoulense]OYR60129.1 VapC toxin family PIN domain ribonuclease [Halorubrum ezzemoulense]OYR78358.1 VapC toxin family PIN domain ribonuclease [Halorubrum ezzemoulense]OYR86171.1 VapC toxin family PIN domain ribonuclease [Halorubrum ezzemoulense]PHQ41557.1 VapC toxin family PIN domain ribonuclease [Halorubrum sp. C191]